MKGICALYGVEAELKNSHIIPKFVFDYLKNTGGKYMRKLDNPNLRVQDGPKTYLLCELAEQEFSKRERWFVNNIFHPYLKNPTSNLSYDENFAYFVISVLWRILTQQRKHPVIANNPGYNILKDVEEDWRLYLNDPKMKPQFNDLNVFLTDRLQSHNTEGLGADFYLSRAIDATIISDPACTKVAVYIKFLRFVFWSVVKGDTNDCPEIKISFDNGEIKVPQRIRDDFFGGFLNNRIKEVDSRPKASPEQQKKIVEEILKNENEFWESDAGLSMINDHNLRNA